MIHILKILFYLQEILENQDVVQNVLFIIVVTKCPENIEEKKTIMVF